MEKKIRVAITHGDTNGIGYELIFKIFAESDMFELCTPIVYGSPKIAAYHRKALDTQANFSIISSAKEAKEGRLNMLTCFDEETKVDLGTPTPESGKAALMALDRAITDFRDDAFDVLVTAPVSTDNMQSNDFTFTTPAHYIEACLGDGQKMLNIMFNDALRVAVATDNMPLKKVLDAISQDSIVEKATVLSHALKRDFRISHPRIAILALNPHADGPEEKTAIAPAVKALAEKSIQAFGPFAAEDFFGNGSYEAFDGVLAMYHDQGMIPFKTLVSSTGISYAAGLPIVCTMPDQDPSFGIAGQGIADESILRHAIYAAIDIFRHRIDYDEPMAHPLPKLYHEKRDESEKVRFAIPKKNENTAKEHTTGKTSGQAATKE